MAKDEQFTKYEMAHMIGTRALQISQGAPSKLKFSEKDLQAMRYNPIEIAKKEFEAGVIPLRVVRPHAVTIASSDIDADNKAVD